MNQKIKDNLNLFWDNFGVWLVVFAFFAIIGVIWYFTSCGELGFILFLFLTLVVFFILMVIVNFFSSWLDKKFGNESNWSLYPSLIGYILCFVGAFIFFGVTEKYWDFEENNRKEAYSGITVYRTPYGDCYHYDYNCYHIRNHEIKTTNLYKAEKSGLRPCMDCSL